MLRQIIILRIYWVDCTGLIEYTHHLFTYHFANAWSDLLLWDMVFFSSSPRIPKVMPSTANMGSNPKPPVPSSVWVIVPSIKPQNVTAVPLGLQYPTTDMNFAPLSPSPTSSSNFKIPGFPIVLATYAEYGPGNPPRASIKSCLLYTSDAADEEDSVDLGGRR